MKAELFCVDGAHEKEPLHYRECGLENIYLLNGFTREVVDGEEYVRIDNMEGLWKAIGLHLVERRKTLSPKELRFLRQRIDMTQNELAQILRVSDQTVARWEKGETEVPGPADIAMRVAFLASPTAQPEGHQILDKIMALLSDLNQADETSELRLSFRFEEQGWEELEAA